MVPKEKKINKQKDEMTIYQDGCIVGIKWMNKKLWLPFLVVMVTLK